MTSLDDKLAALPEHLRAEALRRLAGTQPQAAPVPTVPVVRRGGPLPLSSAQQSLWFLAELDPGSVEYNATWALRLRGDLDLDALTTAVDTVVSRHESLRTTFESIDGRGVQIVRDHTPVPVPVLDGDSEAAVLEHLRAEMATPFDLRTGPVLRAQVVRVAEQEHVLALTMHHIVGDGWSTGRLFSELAAVYTAEVQGTAPQLPDLVVQYPDYAAWEQVRASSGALEDGLDHWRRVLDGVRPLDLPTDRPRPPVRTPVGAVHVFDLPADLVSRLRALAVASGSTLFMPLAAATTVLLSRYSGERDIAVGTVTAGRELPELDDLVGLFINTVVLRSRVDEAETFTEFLAAFRSTLLEAFAHADVPFHRLVEALRPERDPSRPPLVQVMVNLQNTADTVPTIPGLVVSEVKPPIEVAKLDLAFDFDDHGDALTCSVEYSTDLYDAVTVERMGRHLLVLLESAVRAPEEPMRGLAMLTERERHDLTVGWQGRELATGPVRPIHEVFDDRAALHPDAVAVRSGHDRLTFAGLVARANQVANRLVELGVRPGVLVGVCLDRGVDAVVALLGVLKAGGAFVPVDPEYPARRVTEMLTDAAVPVVITERALRDRVTGTGAVLLFPDEVESTSDDSAPGVEVSPDDLAYVVYTSGSTGKPKGVRISHRNVHFIVHAWDDRYGLSALRGRCLSVSSLGVDLFFGDFLLSALFGGEMLVGPAEVMTDPPALAALVAAEAPQILITTPSLLKAVAQEPEWVGGLAALRVLAIGSEPWLVEDCAQVLAHLGPDTVVTNNYGATETTVDSTVFDVRSVGEDGPAIMPIGRPLANTKVYVLDPHGRPVPVGVPGEIHVGGDGVAQGYLNRPELTEQRFTADPFATTPGARLYRTGDVGRWRADGTLEIAGRVDDQVKVRGFRVELGEVETAMARHAGISAAAAAVRRADDGRDRLVGYAVPAAGGAPDLAGLRAFLADSLPDPAVPSALVVLDALPMTPNGTLDRRALPTPQWQVRGAADRVAPRDHVETVLVEVWADLLGADRAAIGVTDNFFGLGGDSIVGLRVVSRARQAGLRLSAKQIFLHQTIAELARVVTVDETPTAVAGPATGEARLTPVQRWYFERFPDGAAHYTQSVFLELAPEVDLAALDTALSAVFDHHDAFRLRFEHTADGWRQHYTESGHGVTLRSVKLSTVEDREGAIRTATLAAQEGMRLTDGPVGAAILFTSDHAPRLFLAAHHLVVDGVSWRVILADFAQAYAAAVQGRAPELPARTSSFGHWSERLHEAVVAGRFDTEREYWAAVKVDQPLPVDGDGPNLVGSSAVVSVEVDPDTTAALLQDVPDTYRTQVNDILLSALATVLTRWTGGDSIGVEIEGHGREDLFLDVDLSSTVGWFTTIYPVALTPGPDWAATIKTVKECLRAVPSAGLGYGALRYLAEDSGLRQVGECQVGFNYHGRLDLDETDDGAPYRRWLTSPVRDEGDDLARANLIEVVGMVREGRLRFDWEYSTARHDHATIARLAEEYTAALREIVEHCAEPGTGGRTPSDFPLAGLDQAGVDRIAGDGPLVEDVYPLTPMQNGLLFHSLGGHDTDIYLTHFGVHLDGVTDPRDLDDAWQRVLDATPVLRTAVSGAEAGEPRQVVHKGVRLPVAHHDWRGLTGAERDEAERALWEEAKHTRIDLTRPPLLRLHLARTSDTSVFLLCSSHHILLDGWSFAEVLSDVYEQYAARTPVAPKSRRPYREYVRWLGEQDQDAAAEHWRGVLAGFTAPTPLPFDRVPTRAHQTHDSAWFDLALSTGDTARLVDFARHSRVTVNTILQAAWALLLARFSGERDVCFGTTVSGRPADLAGADDMIGLFINTLPARITLDRDLDVASWLRRIQEQQVHARQHEHVSLAQVRQWSEVEQGSGLFDSAVVFENYPWDADAAGKSGLVARSMTSAESSTFALTCVAELTGALSMRFGYDPHLFDRDTAARMSEHLLRTLSDLVESPTVPLSRLPAVGGEELRRLVVDWNDSAAEYPDRCLHEVFADHARRTPDAPAVVCGDVRLTYGELDARADRLAGELAARGVGLEVPVAVFLDGGPDMITALLGVLKAGGAYVPVDPGYPAERVAHLFADTAVPLVLTESRLVDRLPATAAEVFLLDGPRDATAALPAVAVHPDNLAGLIFTSGSTGVPKGSMITHRGLVRLVLAEGEHTFGGAPVIAQHHSVSFDAAQNEIWNALLTGACLAVRPGGFHSVDELADFLRANDVAAMSFAAGFFHAIADTDPGILSGLRKVVCGGEALSPAHCAKVLDRLPDLRIVNAYGPTECSVTATCSPVEEIPAGAVAVPVGRPVANATVHLLDRDLNPVPVGVAGEAYIGGDGVTRGFLSRPGMTAERFVADPFGPPGSRLYRTGDLMRRRPDGTLEFVGRTDDQVKVRGFRIELAEVEKAVARHPRVATTAVVVREDRPGRKQLVGYVVPDGELDPVELRAFVAAALPEHMVPAAFVVLDRFPLTPNGKVDRRALPAPVTGSADRPHVAPSSPDEQAMAAIWADVLGVDRIGARDNFFDLGGDSILSIQVVFRSRQAGLAISSSDLFRYPTIAELTAVAGQGERVVANQGVVEGAVPLTPIQRSFFDREPVAPHHFNQAVLVELVEGVDVDAVRAAFAAVLDHHDALRMRYTVEDGRWTQYNAAAEAGEVLRCVDLSAVAEADRAEVIRELSVDADSTMDLANGPLLRAVLFDCGPGVRPWLHITAHHLVIDTVSWRVLSDDLDTAYRQAVAGEPVRLGAKTTSFRDWALRLAGHVIDGGFDDDLQHWASLPAPTPLPVDHDGLNVVSSRRVLRFSLTEQDTATLLHVAPGTFRARVNDVLLGALAWSLCRWTGSDRLLVELEGHGREEIFDDVDLSRTVGWFTTSYPVLLAVPEGDDWASLVKSVRRGLRAVPANGLSHGALAHLSPSGVLAERAHPQVVFNYHSHIDEITRVDGRSLYHAFHDSAGAEQHSGEKALQLLEIVGAARNGRLSFDWHYSTAVHDLTTIERVAGEFLAALTAIARQCDATVEGELP
ncbi:non-ribosomal peptide synthetase [Actinokineospora terrae]|uniref:Non-ribosomal peptide synthase domain TIGR01720/amino acid adenylation domain-containing protein n=1 Tax=Actinokineospora terrae TaxID=155974 RepID=A0A1H9X953_9PSEU|nr:non-ribosomal peptide synthetase [Actinokineospora terrae]SES42611.1 non-ribosomal peptide synthase domain TIGR01720/amino acid adenylation domain-containing protein [Actinokineospora terrae]